MNENSNELSISEESTLINSIRGNDVEKANDAWEELHKDIEAQIEKLVKDLHWYYLTKDAEKRARLAAWLGFVETIKKYKSNKPCLYSSISNNMQLQVNMYYDREPSEPHIVDYKNKLAIPSVAWMARMDAENNQYITPGSKNYFSMGKHDYKERGKYSDERLSLQIMEVLRKFTDENHKLSCDELYYYLEAYRITKHGNSSKCGSRNAFLKTVSETLNELGPDGYCMKDKVAYISNLNMKEADPQIVDNAVEFSDISYIHPLDNQALDYLVQTIYFSNELSHSQKNQLVSKLLSTASVYYESPYLNNIDHAFTFDIQNKTEEHSELADNLITIQNAIKHLAQVTFKYIKYNENKNAEIVSELTVSPYHLINYQGYFYLICAKENEEQICHLRVDLMSEVVMESYADGIPVPIDIVPFEGLPLFNPDWDVDKYSAEHINMASETPTDIRVKISSKDSTIYTLLHDWFGNHFEVIKKSDETDFETIHVKTSPSMIISLAMQHPDKIEVLNEKIREDIRERIKNLSKKYS